MATSVRPVRRKKMNHKSNWKRRRPGEIPRARRASWTAVLASAVVALAVLATACGGSSAGGEGVATAGGTGGKKASDASNKKDPQDAALEFARCMREHGVDMPDPEVSEDGLMLIGPGPEAGQQGESRPPAGFEEAHKACQHLLEDLIQDGAGQADPQDQDRALKFAKCMREHGVNLPDPDLSKGGTAVEIGAGQGIDPTSETFKQAHKACAGVLGHGAGEPGAGVGRRAS
jgi:hypothetical protein